jgi:hypothetical protein
VTWVAELNTDKAWQSCLKTEDFAELTMTSSHTKPDWCLPQHTRLSAGLLFADLQLQLLLEQIKWLFALSQQCYWFVPVAEWSF